MWSRRAIGWSTNNLSLMCEGVVSQSHCSYMRVYIKCRETLYVGMVRMRNIVTVKTKVLNAGQLDFTANRGLEGLTTGQPIDLESTQSSMSPCSV